MAGTLNGADGTFSGDLSAAGGTFKGDLETAGGTFSGNLSGATGTFAGELKAATGTFAGDLSAVGGTFTGTVNTGDIISSTIKWTGGVNEADGHLKRTTGSDSDGDTQLIELSSTKGMVIKAEGGGMRLEASGGIWITCDGDTKYNLKELLPKLAKLV